MLAVVYRPESGVTVEEQPVPVPSAGEALIKVIRAGICCTDIQITQGYGGMYCYQGVIMVQTTLFNFLVSSF